MLENEKYQNYIRPPKPETTEINVRLPETYTISIYLFIYLSIHIMTFNPSPRPPFEQILTLTMKRKVHLMGSLGTLK